MISVLIVDDEFFFRRGVAASLAGDTSIKVIGDADNGFEAVAAVDRLKPQLVLMDLKMPGLSGAEATRRIKANHPDITVVALTASEDEADLFEAIQAGADGYLLKNVGPDQLAGAVRQAAEGHSPVSPTMTTAILRGLRLGGPVGQNASAPATPLTVRELEVLQHAAQGLAYKEIAAKLYVAESTIKNHMRHIMEKLNLRNRSEAVLYAVQNGLVQKQR